MKTIPSPNFEARRDGQMPTYIILHGTWTKTLAQSLDFLTRADTDNRVSAHYLIDTDGTPYQLVDTCHRAWHAGTSHWRGIDDMNSASIGIELQNDGHTAYTAPQIAALIDLIKSLMARHAIVPDNLLAHSDIAPARKDDPGAHFPWAELGTQGAARWPEIRDADAQFVAEIANDAALFTKALHAFGYDPRLDARLLRNAFDLHFVPEAFLEIAPNGIEMLRAQRLAALLSSESQRDADK